MKALKIIGIIILVLVVLIIVLGIIAPKDYHVERSIVINAPRAIVFDHVKYWRNWKSWSPWAAQDSMMEVTVTGKDGTAGSIYKWIGDPEITGKGEMTNTGIEELEEINFHLHFIEPWESESDGYVRVSDVDGGTKAAWGFHGKNPFPWNIMMLFMSMDKMIGKDFEHGLELLKKVTEKEAAEIEKYDVVEIDFTGKTYAAVREKVAFADMQGFFTKYYGIIGQVLKSKRVEIIGAPVGLYFSWDEQTMESDMAAAFPVNKAVEMNEVEPIEVPASNAFLINYYGPYDGSVYAHKALDYHIREAGLTMKPPVIEEYITDPGSQPDSSKWLTRIIYLYE